MEVRRPKRINPHAEACLRALAALPAARCLSLGGAFALAHFHEYRPTNDLDAWWADDVTAAEQAAVLATVRAALEPFGVVAERRHGDVISIELQRETRVVFSFQIARRSALLAAVTASPWPPIRLDSLDDLVAAKMAALIERGAPRDFLDVFELCRVSLTTVARCWELWQQREQARGVAQPDPRTAAEAIRVHLSRIERMRPLDAIESPADRARAKTVRDWFKNDFCRRQFELD